MKMISTREQTYRKIVTLLYKNPRGLTIKEVSTKMKLSYNYTAQSLDVLSRRGSIKRDRKGKSLLYIFLERKPEPRPDNIKSQDLVLSLGAQGLKDLLEHWAEKPWYPRIFQSARNLPYGLAKLFECAVETAYGSSVGQSDLDNVRQGLDEFKRDLEQTLRIVNGVLKDGNLWLPSRFAIYLLETGDVETLKKLSQKAKELN
jgi:hypothetical protein